MRTGRKAWRVGVVVALLIVAVAVPTLSSVVHPPPPAVAQGIPACNGYPCLSSFAELAAWSPAGADPRQIASVPVAPRVPVAGPRMMLGIDTSGWDYAALGDGSTQGGPVGNLYSFTHWQHVDIAYYYHHGLISIPPVVWTNAAHRNGVRMLAVVTADYNDCDVSSGAAMNELFTPGNVETTKHQLKEMARTYGFDGWILDFECHATITPGVLEVLADLDANGLVSSVYEAFKPELPSDDPQLLPAANAASTWQSDYPIGPFTAKHTFDTLTAQNPPALQPFDAYSSENLYQSEDSSHPPCPAGMLSNTRACLDLDKFLSHLGYVQDESAPGGAWTSFGVYAPGWPAYGGSQSIGDPLPPISIWREIDRRIWEGVAPTGPTCDTGESGAVSQFLAPRSTLSHLPFVTRFNRGIGTGYSVAGTRVSSAHWNHFGATDVLPLWFCRLAGADTEATIAYADGLAWNGDTALHIAGTVPGGGAEEWALWSADVPLVEPVLRVRHRGTGPSPFVRLSFADGGSVVVPVTGTEVVGGWLTTSVALPEAAGRTLTRISVGVANADPTAHSVGLLLGELALVEADQLVAPVPITLTPAPILTWTVAAGETSANVWAVDGAAGCAQLLGPAFTGSYDLTTPLFPDNVPAEVSGYVVQPISAAGVAAPLGVRPCAVPPDPPTPTPTPTPTPAIVPAAAAPIRATPAFTG